MNDKKLSIVIPTIGRTLLDKTIESVLAQNVLPYEIVVWDNSGTGAALEQSKYKDDPSIKWYISENKKDIISSWNRAVECTSGEYVYILGDDDLLLPGFVEKVLNGLNNGAEFIHVPAQIIDPFDCVLEIEKTNLDADRRITAWEFIDNFLNKGGRIYLGSMVFSRADYEGIGGFKDTVMNALTMDILFHFEIIFLHEKILAFAEPIWQYRTLVSDWSGGLKKKEEIPLLIQQYSALREYLRGTKLFENKKLFKKFERIMIFSSITRSAYFISPRYGWMLLFSGKFTFTEKLYILRDIFYLIRRH